MQLRLCTRGFQPRNPSNIAAIAELQNTKSNILTCFKTQKLPKPKLYKHIKAYNNKETKTNKRIQVKKEKKIERKFRLIPQTKSSSSLIFGRSPQSNLFTIKNKSDQQS